MTAWVICACWRYHVIEGEPGIHRRRCGCGKFVTIFLRAPSQYLEID